MKVNYSEVGLPMEDARHTMISSTMLAQIRVNRWGSDPNGGYCNRIFALSCSGVCKYSCFLSHFAIVGGSWCPPS